MADRSSLEAAKVEAAIGNRILAECGLAVGVRAMVHLEHQARLNYLAMCAAGPNHPSIPLHLAEEVALAHPEAEPHIKARLAHVPGGRPHGGIWTYFREVVTADM